MTANLAQNLLDTAARDADAPALRLDDTTLNYGFFAEGAARIAGLLKAKGVESGDRVGIMLPNVPYFPVVYYGILRLGGIVVPMNVLLKARETGFYLSNPEAKVVFAWHDFLEAAEGGAQEAGAEVIAVKPGEFEQLLGGAEPHYDVAEKAPEDTAVILYTSGTTGQPKGAEITHGNLGSNTQACINLYDSGPSDVVLGALPLFHTFGATCAMNTCVKSGALLTLIPRFDPVKALEIIERDGVTQFLGVPTMYGAMLHAANAGEADTSTLRVCASGGASLPVEVLKQFQDKFNTKILEGYGLSETSPVASFSHPDKEQKPGSIGTVIEDVEMKIVDDEGQEVPVGDVGEIVIKGPNVMKGYWKREEATAEAIRDGWFHTGDIGKVDEDGYFFIVDRKKDMIIRGGYNVYPREIEEVLYEHEAVREAAVIGVPHDEWGEEIGAAVALKEGQDVSPEDIKAFVKEQVASYKYPRLVWIVDELPKGPTGKILKREIEVPAEVGEEAKA